MNYDAVIFDNDGVLTHPTPFDVLRGATLEGFAAVGVDDPHPDHVDELTLGVMPGDLDAACTAHDVGKTTSSSSPAHQNTECSEDVDPDDLWYERDLAFSRAQVADMEAGRKPLYDDYDAVPGLGLPCGIVSTNQHRTIEEILNFHEIRVDFATHYGREMEVASLTKKKPNAHYLERALSDLGVEPERALFVGDSESDVEAAANAGTDSAFVWRDHHEEDGLSVTPDYELDGLDDLHGLV